MIRAMLIIGGAALIVGLTLYTLLDAVRTPAHEARTLPKWLWVLVTLLFPVVGPLMWLILAAPRHSPQQALLAPASVSDATPRHPRYLPPTTMKSTCAGSKQKQNANATAAKQNRTTSRILLIRIPSLRTLSLRIPRTARRIRVTGRTSQDS